MMLLGTLISLFLSVLLVVLLFLVLNPQKVATEKLQRFVTGLLDATNRDAINAEEEPYYEKTASVSTSGDLSTMSNADGNVAQQPPMPPDIILTDTPVQIENVELVDGKYLVQRLSVDAPTVGAGEGDTGGGAATTAVVFVQGGAFIAAQLNAEKLQDALHPLDVLMGADLFLFQYPVRFNVGTQEMVDYIATFLDRYLTGRLSSYKKVFVVAYSAGAYLTVKALTASKMNILNRLHGVCFVSGYFGYLSLVDVMYLGPERTPFQNLLNWDRAQRDVTLAPLPSSPKIIFLVGSRDPIVRSTLSYARLCGGRVVIMKALAHFDLYRPRATNLISRYVRQWIASL